MTEQTENKHRHAIVRTLTEIALPAAGFTLSVGFATRNWLASGVTGLAISSAIYVL